MPGPTIQQVEQFMKQNRSFFSPKGGTGDFYSRRNAEDMWNDYAGKLYDLLQEQGLEWRKENFPALLQNEAFRQFIMDNQDHPALVLWRDDPIHVREEKETVLRESTFNVCLYQIKEKAKDLLKRGENEAATAATTLHATLTTCKDDFLEARKTSAEFLTGCKDALKTAEEGVLKNQRSILGSIFQGLKKIINTLSCGFIKIEPTPTDSIQKTQQMKDVVNKLSRSDQDQNDKPSEEIAHP